MNPLENDAKFVPVSKKPKFWIAICAVAAFAGAVAIGFGLCHILNYKMCNYSTQPYVKSYPKDFTAVCSLPQFKAALENYSIHCEGGTALDRMHSLWWDGDRIENYCCEASKPDTGSHVTQCVAFATRQDLENFEAATNQ